MGGATGTLICATTLAPLPLTTTMDDDDAEYMQGSEDEVSSAFLVR